MLKKSIIGMALLGAVGLYGSLKVQADPVASCNTIQDCRALVARFEARIRELEAGQTATTSTGAIFSRVADIQAFGEAWRDPSGTIWSEEFLSNTRSSYQYQHDAAAHCASIGAELPSRADFERLREYMGYPANYSFQVLSVKYPYNRHVVQYWTNEFTDGLSRLNTYYFAPGSGNIAAGYSDSPYALYRCVKR